MSDALNYLEGVVSPGAGTRGEYQWEDILGAVDVVFAEPFSREAERVMLAILRFGGRIRLAESSELPHSMTPEDMLKSYSVQWLVRETGLTHLSNLQLVEATTASPVLASAVRAAVRGAEPRQPSARELEVVTLLRPSPRLKAMAEGLGQRDDRGTRKPLPGARPKAPAAQQPSRGNYTVYRVPVAAYRKNIVEKAVILDQGLHFFAGSCGTIWSSGEVAAPRKVARKRAHA